jgi:hypothetical protein
VVGQINGGTAFRVNAITHSRVRVADERRLNVERTNVEGETWDIVTGYAREVAKVHGKKRWGEVAGQAGTERERATCRPPDMDINSRMMERTEKTQPLDVVHVEVSEEDVDPSDIRRDLCSESADAGASIEHKHRAVVPTHLNGRCVSSIS